MELIDQFCEALKTADEVYLTKTSFRLFAEESLPKAGKALQDAVNCLRTIQKHGTGADGNSYEATLAYLCLSKIEQII